MWAEAASPEYERTGLRYASDLSDGEWRLLAPGCRLGEALAMVR